MNENTIKGNWEQIKGNVQKKWGELTDDELDQINGNRKILAGKIQEKYGRGQDEPDIIHNISRTAISPVPALPLPARGFF